MFTPHKDSNLGRAGIELGILQSEVIDLSKCANLAHSNQVKTTIKIATVT